MSMQLSLAWRILTAILVTTLSISIVATFFAITFFWQRLEQERLEGLEDYIGERALQTNAVFETIETSHQVAIAALERRLGALSDEQVNERFDRLFPQQPDGTRRSADALYDGYTDLDGDFHRGVGAYLNPESPQNTGQKRMLLAAYSVVDRGGEMLDGLVDNLYFFSPNNELIISAINRPDQLVFYRRDAPTDFNLNEASFTQLVAPGNNPAGQFVCDELRPLIYVQSREALTTGCFTPVIVNGVHLGAFGTTIQLRSYFESAIADVPDDAQNVFIDQSGTLIAHHNLLEGDITSEEVASISEALELPRIQTAILEDGRGSGAIIIEDSPWVIAFAHLPKPGWNFVTLVDRSVHRAHIIASASQILILGVAGIVVQAILIYLVLYRLIINPITALTRRFGDLPRGTVHRDEVLGRTLNARHEIGELSRTLERHREESESLLEDLENRVSERTQQLEDVNKAQGDFLANMSHELRTPLNGIMGMAEVLENSVTTPADRTHARMINDCGETLTLLLNDVLDMSKIEAGQMELAIELTDLHRVLTNAHGLYMATAEAKGLSYALDIDESVPQFAMLDALRVKQCLTNLISNALKFTDSGSVLVNVSGEMHGEDCRVQVQVHDTGIGIDEDAKNRLFSAFTQAESSTATKFGGTGLGLAIAQNLARLMNGDINVTSALGEGSKFELVFDVEPSTSNVVDDPSKRLQSLINDPAYVCLKNVRVLLVEDNFINREVAKAFLNPLTTNVTEAFNGAAALKTLSTETFDLILMDVRMPEMDGFEATMRIRNEGQAWSTLPIIALTADASAADVRRCHAAGMNAHISKPLSVNELYENMLGVLNPVPTTEASNN
jgi:signal transduction histidine kinase/ActR/RegA family two-component response regulator